MKKYSIVAILLIFIISGCSSNSSDNEKNEKYNNVVSVYDADNAASVKEINSKEKEAHDEETKTAADYEVEKNVPKEGSEDLDLFTVVNNNDTNAITENIEIEHIFDVDLNKDIVKCSNGIQIVFDSDYDEIVEEAFNDEEAFTLFIKNIADKYYDKYSSINILYRKLGTVEEEYSEDEICQINNLSNYREDFNIQYMIKVNNEIFYITKDKELKFIGKEDWELN